MDYLPTLLVSNGVFIVLFVALWLFLSAKRKRDVVALSARLKPEAAQRGWTVDTALRDNGRIIRWQGQNDGIRWIAEDFYRKTKGKHHESVLSITRWQTVDLPVVTSGAVFLMGVPDGAPVPKAEPMGEGLLASLALKAVTYALDKGLDVYFGHAIGTEIDAGTLKRVERLEPLLEGYAVMAENPSDAVNVLSGDVVDAIRATITNGPESVRGYRRPWILIWKKGVVIGRMGEAASAAEIEPVLQAGLAIARAVRF